MKTVDMYLAQSPWKPLLDILRKIALSTGLKEEIKWGAPVYTFNGKNILGIVAFKSHAAIWFYQGALLQDKQGKLINAQEGKTKAMRHWRFSSISEIDEELVCAYMLEAMDNQKAGREILPEPKEEKALAPELKSLFERDMVLQKKFHELAPYKQRDYNEYISEAKRAETKASRIEKIIPLIKEGSGLNDAYKK